MKHRIRIFCSAEPVSNKIGTFVNVELFLPCSLLNEKHLKAPKSKNIDIFEMKYPYLDKKIANVDFLK